MSPHIHRYPRGVCVCVCGVYSAGDEPQSLMHAVSVASLAVMQHHDQGCLWKQVYFGIWFQGVRVHDDKDGRQQEQEAETSHLELQA